ncbi:annexin A7 isoform X2, partial [Argonauta hians]
PGYPPQQPGFPGQQPGYPPQQPGYPGQQPGYPPQQPGYPPQQPGYPPSGAGGNGDPAPPGFSMPPSTQPGYPPTSQPGYPPSSQPGYPPSSQPGYPPSSQPGYPPASQPGYPPASQAGYPPSSQPGYPPSSQPGYPPASQPGYPPASQAAYPPQNQGQTSYPAQPYGQRGGYQPQAQQSLYPNTASSGLDGNKPKPLSEDMKRMTLYGGTSAFRPTVVPAKPFSAEEDAKVLRQAMKGFGTDEASIIHVISKRTNSQRQQISQMFKTMYGKDLIKDLKSELSGNFENAVLAMFKTPAYFDAWSLCEAMSGVGTKESVLIEILCTRTNSEIREIIEIYKSTFKRNLEQDIMSDTSGYFKRLLVSCCQANRNELTTEEMQRVASQGPASVINRQLAQEDARRLYEAGEKKLGTDESTMISVLAIRNYYQMQATFEEYSKIAGKDILDSIRSETSGDLESGMKALVMCARDRPEYFASQLHKAISGLGTKDNTLIRIVVSRSEIDLQNIKESYQRNYGKSLHEAISSDTSGDYKKLLLGIVGQ